MNYRKRKKVLTKMMKDADNTLRSNPLNSAANAAYWFANTQLIELKMSKK